jgi:hypothetical protein
MIIKRLIRHISKQIAARISFPEYPKNETEVLALGKILCNQQRLISSDNIHDYEFKIFSQWGEDGIIQYLINNIHIENTIFVEFGVENYQESNTRFLMMNNNWRGLVIDGSEENIANIHSQEWFWKYDLEAVYAFIDCDNINELLNNYQDIGILSIDIDGNDYHVMNAIDFSKINPSILIVEYNSVWGKDRKITIPYDKNFYRTNAHHSNLYFGASLPALTDLAKQKGYALVGCCSNGANAFFVRKDLLNDIIKEKSVAESYMESRFRESRNIDGLLTFLSREERLSAIKGMPVLNTENGLIEEL